MPARRHGPVIAGCAAAPHPPLRVLAPEPVQFGVLVAPAVAGVHGGRRLAGVAASAPPASPGIMFRQDAARWWQAAARAGAAGGPSLGRLRAMAASFAARSAQLACPGWRGPWWRPAAPVIPPRAAGRQDRGGGAHSGTARPRPGSRRRRAGRGRVPPHNRGARPGGGPGPARGKRPSPGETPAALGPLLPTGKGWRSQRPDDTAAAGTQQRCSR